MEEKENFKWYIASCTSGKENRVIDLLKQRIKANSLGDFFGDAIAPTRETVVVRKGKKEKIKERFLPGYILLNMEATAEVLSTVKTTPGITALLGTTSKTKLPTALTDDYANAVITMTSTQQNPTFDIKLNIGDAVKVIDGAFKDFVGSVKNVNTEKGSVTVNLSIFGRETSVEMDILQVTKI